MCVDITCGHGIQDATLRPRIWKILLRVNDLPAGTFLEYVARGPCEVREKIRNDTFRCVTPCSFWKSVLIADSSVGVLRHRTLATDRGFKERVREDMLVRLLDAFVWRNYGAYHFLDVSPYTVHLLPIHFSSISQNRTHDRSYPQTVKKRTTLASPTSKG